MISKQFVKVTSKPVKKQQRPRLTNQMIKTMLEAIDRQKVVAQKKRGRPQSVKTVISIRLDPDIIEAYRSTGPGWQARMNDALRSAMAKIKINPAG